MGLLILPDSRGTVEDVHQNSRSIQFNYLHHWGIFMHFVSKLLIIIHIIHLNIKKCIVTKSLLQFLIMSKAPGIQWKLLVKSM